MLQPPRPRPEAPRPTGRRAARHRPKRRWAATLMVEESDASESTIDAGHGRRLSRGEPNGGRELEGGEAEVEVEATV